MIGRRRTATHVVEMALFLCLLVAGMRMGFGYWRGRGRARHPLYVGPQLRDMRYPGKPDVLLNLGNKFGERAAPGMKLISMRSDPASLARTAPVDLGMVSDLKLGIADLTSAIKSMATAAQLKQIAEERLAKTSPHP